MDSQVVERKEAGHPEASSSRAAELRAELVGLSSWNLTPRHLCDFERISVGGFAPLRGLMGRAAVESVRREMRLPNGALWPNPVTLDLGARPVRE